jgi:uncharacterized protein YbbC (DUF1343 family)
MQFLFDSLRAQGNLLIKIIESMKFKPTYLIMLVGISICIALLQAFVPLEQSIEGKLQTGAEQMDKYVPYLKDKRVGMVVNQTSIIEGVSSVDKLISLGVKVVTIFGPEHGFRGNASAGVKIDNAVDAKTGIPIFSLYGTHLKPTANDLKGIELMVFDIQDVGARFYTYISTLHYVMEACAENNIELIILDRPNPNGFYVDGPVMEEKQKSFIGMHSVPIVHGLTIAEYAQMINGEGWLINKIKCKLNIVKLANYTHQTPYILPVKPSPNLNTQRSILLYPSLCLFEGTILSQGRGTLFPFQLLGSPDFAGKYKFSFRPISIPGMSESPIHKDKLCFGIDLRSYNIEKFRKTGQINLKWLIDLYQAYPDKSKFFDNKQSPQIGNFNRLAGTEALKQQIIDGKSEEEIRMSWEPALSSYKMMRRSYLLYQ